MEDFLASAVHLTNMPDSPSTKAKEPKIHSNIDDDHHPKNPKLSKKHEEPEVVEVLEDEKSKPASSWPQALQDLKARREV